MSKSLVIVESPAKAKTIGKYLGKDFEVLASVGHIMDLPKNDLGVELKKRWSWNICELTTRCRSTRFSRSSKRN